ncbi:MAG TPA: ribulose-phosphate 3-epimerase [Candidatus Cloacimonadota bacterium]|nr:ribulose-phosphate 3-epimerase [Candidatus Cloacimonadota bacterium]HPS38683.1 ribulose-phosphate 3-epimerase [Candidatus Cloacimonadota bacterium]
MNTPQVAVSILSADFGDIAHELGKLKDAHADLIHLDIMDGHYVPNLTFGVPVIKRIAGLTQIPMDAHLMVTNPENYIDPLAELGMRYFSFHQETVYHSHRVVQVIRSRGMKAGIALNPATPVSTLQDIISELDFVLLMSVNPGFSGQSFIPIYSKITELKELIIRSGSQALIEIDGGVNSENAAKLVSAGADILVSASYIFSGSDYATRIMRLKNQQ